MPNRWQQATLDALDVLADADRIVVVEHGDGATLCYLAVKDNDVVGEVTVGAMGGLTLERVVAPTPVPDGPCSICTGAMPSGETCQACGWVEP